jgi:hypothetical protein
MTQGRLRRFPQRLPFGPMGGCSYSWRALSEPGESARPLPCIRPIQLGRTVREWFWVLLPKQKTSSAGAKPGHFPHRLDMTDSSLVEMDVLESAQELSDATLKCLINHDKQSEHSTRFFHHINMRDSIFEIAI